MGYSNLRMSSGKNIMENMSRDYLEIELDAIKNENIIKTKEIEDYKLQIDKLKHSVAISSSVEQLFFSETESLKSIHDAKIEELMKKITLHEEQIRLLHNKHTETIKYYENELIKKESFCDCMNEIKKSAKNAKGDLIVKLEMKITDLTEKLTEHEFNNNLLKHQNNVIFSQ